MVLDIAVLVDPSNAEATFIQWTGTQNSLKSN